ncbi:MAG: hypothetical protein JWO91_484 [Acidobacteriaceae bacterium]|nr:hypothetical protein [Acidobacteriaceae bacterium]
MKRASFQSVKIFALKAACFALWLAPFLIAQSSHGHGGGGVSPTSNYPTAHGSA